MFDNLDDPTDDIQKFDAGQPLTEKPGKGQKVRGGSMKLLFSSEGESRVKTVIVLYRR